ncbi:MAG: COR domain-containing protein [Candidatus Electrothrix scaldis]|nr:MAG: COR domain-containing protein [Candidatus Electrothrix sp. GW3-3]
MASNDLEVIEEIEKALRVRLRRYEPKFKHEDITLCPYNYCYVVNEQGEVIALRLRNVNIHLFLTDHPELKEFNIEELINNQTSAPSVLKELQPPPLHRLNLRYKHFFPFLKKLSQLHTLDLSGNNIDDISFLKDLVQLHTLNLCNNNIRDISALKNLKKLQYINLSRNNIEDISVIRNFLFLKELNVENNSIAKLQSWIIELPPKLFFLAKYRFITPKDKINKINVSGNPLTSPPPEIIKQGCEAIRAYFQSLEKEETVRLHEAKILLVGEGMAGKTSLLKRLQGLDFDKKESQTHGINVLSLSSNQLPGFNNDDECRLHFWDFGGQEIMHASHRFFMSNRSLYILVLDSRTDSRKFHWLRHIEKYGGKSPLIVTMNKIDLNPSYNIEQKSINSRFPWINNRFFRISCKNQDGLPELVRSIATAVPNTPLFGMEISKSWLAVRTELEQATGAQNYINRDQFLTICAKHGVDDEISRMTLLKLLNDLGTVLFFENLPLTDIYVLDPHWVTVGVYKIINSERTKDGLLRETDLEFILNEEKIRCDEYDPAREKQFTYTRTELQYLIKIMQEFKLCYLYSESEHLYILPNQLPKEPEQEPELHGENLLRFHMEYDFLPTSLFSRLMVRLKEDIQNRRQQWRYGMFLKNTDHDVQAIIRMEEQNNRIMITIKGGLHSKRQYLSIIRHAIEGLGFQELVPKELVELPGYPGHFADYQNLLGYERKGWDTYCDGILGESFSVSDLLDSVVSKDERNKEGERNMSGEHHHFHFENIGNPNVTVTQNNTQTVNQSIDLLKDAQALFRNLKEDILDEVDDEIEDEKEKKRVARELDKAEKALTEAKEAAAQGKEPDAATKSRLEEFFTSLADKSSRLGKALEFVDQGAQKVQKLARTYNSIAGNIGLPTVPPLLLGKEK